MNADVPKPWPGRTRELRIGAVAVDLRRRLVTHPGGTTELPQRMFDLLLLFAAEPHRVHARAALLERVWAGVIVEDANLSQSVWMLRKALGAERKDWIRTLSKQGYRFEPPGDVVAIAEPAGEDAAARGADAPPITPSRRTAAPARRRRRWITLAATTAALSLVVAMLAGSQPLPTASADMPRSVTLIPVEDPGASAADRAPLTLLGAWLEWKLSAHPEIGVLTPAHLAADPASQTTNRVVLLFSGVAPADPSRLLLRAQFQDAHGPRQLQVSGPASAPGPLVDRLADQVMAALFPDTHRGPWPRLDADAVAARTFAAQRQAYLAHDWPRALVLGRALTERAPRFAPGHLQLSQTFARLGQLPAARAHLARARALLAPMPPAARDVLDAQLLALSPRHADAVAAYARLAARYPEQAVFSLQLARALGRTGRFADALEVLSGPVWRRPQPAAMDMLRWTHRSGLELSMGNPSAALASARRADALAQAAGPGWADERGMTLLMLAQVDGYFGNGGRESPYFEAAARQYALADDDFFALRARFLGEVSGPPRTPPKYIDAWIAQTRAAGQQQFELGALGDVAYQHYRAGDIASYRRWLSQGLAVARSMHDDRGIAASELALAYDDYLRGDFDRVDARLARARAQRLQGILRTRADVMDAVVAQFRGRNLAALAVVRQPPVAGARLARRLPNAMTDDYACIRAAVQLTMGNAEAARVDYARCPTSDPALRIAGVIGIAEVDLYAGDRLAARAAARRARAQIGQVPAAPARWVLSLDVASVLAASGDPDAAGRLYADVLPSLEASGYRLMAGYARIGLAEVALAQGDPERARRYARDAHASVPGDAWLLTQRLGLVDVALARAQGRADDASLRLASLAREAERRNDVVMQLRVRSVSAAGRPAVAVPAVPAVDPDALIARTGLRGVTARWMMPSLSDAVAREDRR